MEKNLNNITIVTAFFDIGRKEYENSSRSNEIYLDYFKFWARLKNKLIIYTTKDMKDSILSIRNDFGLLDKTKIVIIDNIYSIYPDYYERMEKVQKNKKFLAFRYRDNLVENKAEYNYLMMLKSWFIYDAAKNNYCDKLDMLAWLDFGYNHGGDLFTNPLDFDFEWNYNFDRKIIYFINNDFSDDTPFYLVSSLEVSIMGAPFLVPYELAGKHLNLILGAMNSLLDCGLMDDDQVLMLMAFQKCSNVFELKKSDWFYPLLDYGNKNLTIKSKPIKKQNFISYLLLKYRIIKRRNIFIRKIKKEFTKNYLD